MNNLARDMTLASVSPKPHKCRSCHQPYERLNSFQKFCIPCALKKGRKTLAKQRRSETMEMRARLMTRSDWLKRAQTAFNAWVRERDSGKPCISCGCPLEGRKIDAGHYRSVGSNPALRFEPLNVHSQCVPCNQHKSGNILEYRIGLVQRIGAGKVEWLEGPHPPKKYTVEKIRGIEAEYKARLKVLQSVSD